MFFKVDFAKAYDSVRWDYLLDILQAFGFGPNWCRWIRGDPLAPYLFILIMESLHISFSRVVDDGLFKGFQLHGSVNISHLFYADDAVMEGVAANRIGCAVLNTPFCYLGVTVGECMSRKSAWVGLVNKLQARLSKWKVKTLSIGGRLPSKISWVAGTMFLASKLTVVLPVSSFFALNRALLLKWVWRFISGDGSLWCKVIQAIYGSQFDLHVTNQPSIWCSILREVKSLKDSGFDFSSHCKKQIGEGLVLVFGMINAYFRGKCVDGVIRQQWDVLSSILNSVVLSSSKDRWLVICSGDGESRFKISENFIDDLFLPSSDVETRWVKFIPIKVNLRARRDRLPTRVNLSRRGVLLDSHLCPLCNAAMEDVQHVFFRCDVARVVLRKICRWWDLDWQEICSFSDWDAWFLSFRLSSRLKSILEGVFYVAWWRIWRLRNQLVFDASPPNRSTIFDDIVSCTSYPGFGVVGDEDLELLARTRVIEAGVKVNMAWVYELALRNTCIETLHFRLDFDCDDDDGLDASKALTLLAEKCSESLVSLRVSKLFLDELEGAFSHALKLEYFDGASVDEYCGDSSFNFPMNIRGLRIKKLPETSFHYLLPYLSQLQLFERALRSGTLSFCPGVGRCGGRGWAPVACRDARVGVAYRAGPILVQDEVRCWGGGDGVRGEWRPSDWLCGEGGFFFSGEGGTSKFCCFCLLGGEFGVVGLTRLIENGLKGVGGGCGGAAGGVWMLEGWGGGVWGGNNSDIPNVIKNHLALPFGNGYSIYLKISEGPHGYLYAHIKWRNKSFIDYKCCGCCFTYTPEK
ncbi:RNA-directed DNA polymerase, eukaryota [Tanacetum coccineum]